MTDLYLAIWLLGLGFLIVWNFLLKFTMNDKINEILAACDALIDALAAHMAADVPPDPAMLQPIADKIAAIRAMLP